MLATHVALGARLADPSYWLKRCLDAFADRAPPAKLAEFLSLERRSGNQPLPSNLINYR